MQIKAIMKYCHTPMRTAKIQKTDSITGCQGGARTGTLFTDY